MAELLPTDLIALNAATKELLIEWFESLNHWAWPVFLVPYDEDRRGALITEIERRLGDEVLWRPNRVQWHVDIKLENKKILLCDSTCKTKEEAYIDILRAAHHWSVYKQQTIVVSIEDLQPGRSEYDRDHMV